MTGIRPAYHAGCTIRRTVTTTPSQLGDAPATARLQSGAGESYFGPVYTTSNSTPSGDSNITW